MPARARVRGAVLIGVMLLTTISCTEDAARPVPSPTAPARTLPPDGEDFVGSPSPPGPSQSAADARRDGVPPAVAKQRLVDRIRTAWVSVEIDERTWVAARSNYQEYGEVLLMDRGRTRILRAFPLDGVPPHNLAVTDDAVYCARQGDGGLPHSMVCRIDPDTNTMSVRVFASPDGSPFRDAHDIPKGWELDDDVLEVYEFVADDAGLWAKRYGDLWARLDPDTLEVVDNDVERVTTDP